MSLGKLRYDTSKVFQKKLKGQSMKQSMSRVGHCIDNGPTEGFWGIIKTEMYQMYEITDATSLRYAIKDYIRFYSEERLQEKYNCKTPLEVRTEALTTEATAKFPILENKRIEKYKEKGVHRKTATQICETDHKHLILDIRPVYLTGGISLKSRLMI